MRDFLADFLNRMKGRKKPQTEQEEKEAKERKEQTINTLYSFAELSILSALYITVTLGFCGAVSFVSFFFYRVIMYYV